MAMIDFARVKAFVRMADVLRLIEWTPNTRLDSGQRGRCPIHGGGDGESRCFSVCEKGFRCWKCRREGDLLRLYAEVKRIPIYAAVLDLCRVLHLRVPYLPENPLPVTKRPTEQPTPLTAPHPYRANEHYQKRGK